MPNIAITNYCNLKCPYCFAENYNNNKNIANNNITIEQLNKIFNWLKNSSSKITQLKIIGGEPTLHPQFASIVNAFLNLSNQIKTTDKNILIFSNGIELEKYKNLFQNKRLFVLINLNSENDIGQKNFQKIIKSIESIFSISSNFNLGINLYHNIKDFKYIFDIAKYYNKNHVRYSFTAPCSNTFKTKEEYYSNGKELFLNFINYANQQNIKLIQDCNYIPICYFDEKELLLIKNVCQNYNQYLCSSNPSIDILPNFTAISCFGINQPVSLDHFNSYAELTNYFIRENNLLNLQNNYGKCITCKMHIYNQCQGGCLSFAKKKDIV